jgi:hypothetical protein
MFGFGRPGGFSTLIWIPLIMVPDTYIGLLLVNA